MSSDRALVSSSPYANYNSYTSDAMTYIATEGYIIIAHYEDSTLLASSKLYLPKASPPNTITLEVRVANNRILENTNIQSIPHTLQLYLIWSQHRTLNIFLKHLIIKSVTLHNFLEYFNVLIYWRALDSHGGACAT